MLTNAVELPEDGSGYTRLRRYNRHFGIPRFVETLQRAAKYVATERPGSVLVFGDLSVPKGGQMLPHVGHRVGRDADLLFYYTDLDGSPITAPGFMPVGADGIAWDDKNRRFIRFDVDRTWLLVRFLLLDETARTQWIFAHHVVERMLLEWAFARGESGEALARAQVALHEPHASQGLHHDHLHVRTACDADDVFHGCQPWGPDRWWYAKVDDVESEQSDEALAAELFTP